MDYESIKELAKEDGKSVRDLLALSPNNDPFYVGSKGQMEKAKWFANVYKQMGSPEECHIRRVHYWLVSKALKKPDGSVYENTEEDWGFLTMCAKYARYAGFVPIENMIDKRNPPAIQHANYWDDEVPTEVKESIDSEEIIRTIVQKFYCFNPTNTQAYHIELWAEKSTMNDVLEPLAERYKLNLVTGLGELSITAVNLLMGRIEQADKPVRIFYISDFDPAGECMPVSVARKIEYFVRRDEIEGNDIKLKQIVLTAEQCKKYKLPRTPIKATERRKGGFEERFGVGATELDALEALYAGELKIIVSGEVIPYLDIDLMNEAIEKNIELRDKVKKFLKDKITNVLEKLDVSEFDEFKPSKAEPIDDSDEEWIYNSNLDYEEQIDKYKKFQRKEE